MYTFQKPSSIYVESRHYKLDNGANGGLFDKSNYFGYVEKKSGTKVEEYKAKIGRHENAVSDYEADYYSPSYFPGSLTMNYTISAIPNRPFVEGFTGVLNPSSTVTHLLSYTDEERAKALAKLYDRLIEQKTAFQGVTWLGELPQTLQLLRAPGAALRSAFDKTFRLLESRKLKIRKMPQSVRRRAWEDAVTGTYLEAVFGWAPLISDIEGIAELAKRYIERKRPASRITARSTFAKRDDQVIGNTDYLDLYSEWYLLQNGRRQTVSTEMKVQYNVGLDITQSLNQSDLDRLVKLSGFDLGSFVPGVYNALPWTWMIDYISTLGNVIDAVTYNQAQVRWISETVTTRTLYSTYNIPPSFGQMKAHLLANGRTLGSLTGTYGSMSNVRTTVVRKKLPVIPLPPLIMTTSRLNFKKLLNVSAVLLQLRSHSDMKWLSSKGP